MDYGSLPNWISALATVAVAFAAGVAAWQGVKSLSAWRAETAGRRRMELAEAVIADFYEAQDVVSAVRAPVSEHVPDRPGRDEEPEDIRRHRDLYYLPIKRLADYGEFFGRMRARRYSVMANFGAEANQPYEELQRQIAQIRVAAFTLMHTQPDFAKDGRQLEQERRWRETIWQGAARPDLIKEAVDRIVADVEERFRKEIGPAR